MLTPARAAFIATLLLALLLIFPACGHDGDDSPEDLAQAADDDAHQGADDDQADDDDDAAGDRLYAGAASGYLDAPMGISFAGYAARIGFKSAYSELIGGSLGYLDKPGVKAVALRLGDRHVVFARVSMMAVTESLRTQVVEQVREQTGVELDAGLILNATHTHSGPGRSMYVPDVMGLIGVDVYSQEIVDRLAASISGVIVAALNGLQPARIGFGYREAFDPHERLTVDRRCNNGPGVFKEDRLWVGQVETDDGETLAVLVGMAMHGTVYGYGTFDLTGDAPGGVERAIERLYDHPVTALYVQGSAGDVVPNNWGPLGHGRWQMIEWIGSQVAGLVQGVQREIVTDDQPELRVLTRRYVADRQTLGYLPGEFGHYNRAGEFIEYEAGAMECGVLASKAHDSIADCDNPQTTLVDGYLGCILDLGWSYVADARQYFQQSPLTVAQIGDQYFFTAPGEITSHLAVDIRQSVAEAVGAPFENVNAVGYAQNYIFYILQDWDWRQGGGETEGSLFGWRYGPWLQQQAAWLAGRLAADDPPPDDGPGPNLYSREVVPVPTEKSESLGAVIAQPEPEVARFATVVFSWHGGHGGVDRPSVTLQRREGGTFVDVQRANGAVYDEKGWEMALRMYPVPDYKHEPTRDVRDFQYLLEWETNYDDPAGVLRFKVEGQAETANGVTPYEVVSAPFTLAAADGVTVDDLAAQRAGATLTIEARAAYPCPAPMARRLRSPLGGGHPEHPAIVPGGSAVARVVDGAGHAVDCELSYDQGSGKLVGQLSLDRFAGPLTISIAAEAFDDGFGNTNAEAAGPIVVNP